MVRYSLVCSNGHVFEQWFNTMATYDTQAEAGELVCPECGDTHISKALMAPRLAGAGAGSMGQVGSLPADAPSCGGGDAPACAGCPAAA